MCARLYLDFPWIEAASVRLCGTLPYLPVRLFCACTQRCLPLSPVSSPAFDEAPESKGLHFSNMFFYVSVFFFSPPPFPLVSAFVETNTMRVSGGEARGGGPCHLLFIWHGKEL